MFEIYIKTTPERLWDAITSSELRRRYNLGAGITSAALTPIEVRALGSAAPDREGRPAPVKALLELVRSVLVGAATAGVARACHLHTVGSAVLLGLVLWTGFPLVLLSGSNMWDEVPPVTALLFAIGRH